MLAHLTSLLQPQHLCSLPLLTQVAILSGLAGVPWLVKPLYGFLSDSVPLFGYRRRSYLMICGAVGGCRRCTSSAAVELAARATSSAGRDL